MRRLISIVLCFVILLTVSACGNKPNGDNNKTPSEPVTDTKPNAEANKTPSSSTVLSPDADWDDDGVLKILTIGNSFSNNTMKYVYEIATACGIDKVFLGNLYIGGCTLDTHAENARTDKNAYTYYTNQYGVWIDNKDHKMSEAIKSQNWDFISLQQASADSYNPETFGNLDYLISYVKSLAKDSTLVWNMTWAYDRSKNSRQNYMYTNIISTVQEKVEPQSDIKAIIPCGTAIQNARTSFVGDKMTNDGMHLNTLGEYIAGLTLVHKLTGLPIDNITYKAGLSNNRVAAAIEAVTNAVKKPYEITNSTITK